MANKTISIQTIIDAPIKSVWDFYTKPEHLTKWNNASEDWHTPWARIDFKSGGKFTIRMESKDGKEGFDFSGIYNKIRNRKLIQYTMEDARKVIVTFAENNNNKTRVTIDFEAENQNPLDMQREGWQSILNNFKKYSEKNY